MLLCLTGHRFETLSFLAKNGEEEEGRRKEDREGRRKIKKKGESKKIIYQIHYVYKIKREKPR